ncbi:MAG: hypothetical protein U0L37_01790 [Bacteroidales bacterium]|nr:hypothetical protein [Bacteroidales bacterium]
MDNLTCNMCGSPDVKLEGNYYICNSCGSKYKSSDFNDSSSNERILTEVEKAELERLKTYLEKDHSLAERILELEPNNWLAYCIKYRVDNRWFELLRDSGMTQKEIEKVLTIHYYEKEKDYFVEDLSSYWGEIDDDDIDDFFQDLNSKCLHILSILGDEYSELTKSWQEDAEKFIDECKKTEKRNFEEEKEKENRENRRAGNVMLIIGIILTVILVIVYILIDDDDWLIAVGLGVIPLAFILTGLAARS